MRITRAFMLGQAAAHAGARGAHREAETLLQEVLVADAPGPDRTAMLEATIKDQQAQISAMRNSTPPPITEAQEMLQWLDDKVLMSQTGVSINYRNGYRVLWHHHAGEFFPTLAEAIKDAMK